MKRSTYLSLSLLLLGLGLSGCANQGNMEGSVSSTYGTSGTSVSGVTDAALAETAGREWLHNHGDWQGTRYSTLTELNTSNVADLDLAWTFSTGTTGNNFANPIYHDGILYFPVHGQTLYAVDARSGKKVWSYAHVVPDDYGGFIPNFIGPVSKGVAIYKDRIYFYTNDSKLVALHYKTGEVMFSTQVRPYVHVNEEGQEQLGYYATLAPLVTPGAILLGQSHGEQGGAPAYLDALDPMTGDMLWSANVIPQEGEVGHDTWYGDSAETGGAPLWITGTYDPELNLTFWGTGNAYPWNPYARQGPNLDLANFGATGIMAVDNATGDVVWRTQIVPGDPWDFDTTTAPMVIDLDGRKTLVQPNKTGQIHYLDAKTGQCLRAVEFMKSSLAVPGSVEIYTGWSDETCQPLETIPLPENAGDPVIKCPSLLGYVNMFPSAYNHKTGMVYMAGRDLCDAWGYDEVLEIAGVKTLGASFSFQSPGPEINVAFDVSAGTQTWRDQTEVEGYAGGMLTTAGNLTFYGGANGDINAVNATTGKNLWKFSANICHKSAPITYELDGKQYVAQLSGGTQVGGGGTYFIDTCPNGGMLYVFSR
jgi:alcohol dehydrogenase (cytochrome c)